MVSAFTYLLGDSLPRSSCSRQQHIRVVTRSLGRCDREAIDSRRHLADRIGYRLVEEYHKVRQAVALEVHRNISQNSVGRLPL